MATYLVDSSIWGWAYSGQRTDLTEKLAERLERDEVATCYPVVIEALHRARSGIEYELLYDELFASLQWVQVGKQEIVRSFEVQRAMAAASDGNHRRSALDFVIAASAELAGEHVVLWAFDRDLRVICEHTGQPHEIETPV